MGQLSRAILYGCLEALKFMLWVCAALLLVLVIVERVRGDIDAQPQAQLLLAAGFALGGLLCRWAARFLAAKT